MNKRFLLTSLQHHEFFRVGLSLSYEGIDHYFYDLEDELKRINARGRILIDLLLSNGLKSERFISIYFDGQSLNIESYKIEKSVDSSVINYCSRYYQKNNHLLENSVLTKPQRFLIKKGRVHAAVANK